MDEQELDSAEDLWPLTRTMTHADVIASGGEYISVHDVHRPFRYKKAKTVFFLGIIPTCTAHLTHILTYIHAHTLTHTYTHTHIYIFKNIIHAHCHTHMHMLSECLSLP